MWCPERSITQLHGHCRFNSLLMDMQKGIMESLPFMTGTFLYHDLLCHVQLAQLHMANTLPIKLDVCQ